MHSSMDAPVMFESQASVVGNAGGYVQTPELGAGTSNVPVCPTLVASVLKPIQSTPNGRSNINNGINVRKQKHPAAI